MYTQYVYYNIVLNILNCKTRHVLPTFYNNYGKKKKEKNTTRRNALSINRQRVTRRAVVCIKYNS